MYIGVDPDLHSTAWAMIDDRGYLGALRVDRVKEGKNGFKGLEAALLMCLEIQKHTKLIWSLGQHATAVESQEIYLDGPNKTPNPRSLLHLANVSGAAIACSNSLSSYLVRAQEWKGSLPKRIHHARIFKRLGWAYKITTHTNEKERYGYPVCDLPESLTYKKGDWKHLADAIGLAFFAREKHLKEKRRGTSNID